jgi:hypothetical protein
MSRLTEFARQPAERHAPAAASRCSSPASRLGLAQAGAAARHRLPGHHRDRALPRRRGRRRRGAGRQADRARDGRRARLDRASSRPRQLDRPRRRAVRVRDRRQGGPRHDRAEPPERRPACRRVEPSVNALNINASPVIIASVAATSEDGLDATPRGSPATRSCPRSGHRRRVRRRPDRWRSSSSVTITLDPRQARRERHRPGQVTGALAANNLTFPSGQIQPTARRRSRSRRSAARRRSSRSRTSSSA